MNSIFLVLSWFTMNIHYDIYLYEYFPHCTEIETTGLQDIIWHQMAGRCFVVWYEIYLASVFIVNVKTVSLQRSFKNWHDSVAMQTYYQKLNRTKKYYDYVPFLKIRNDFSNWENKIFKNSLWFYGLTYTAI